MLLRKRIGRALLLALCAGAAGSGAAQRPDLSGTWQRTDPTPPAIEWPRAPTGTPVPCGPDDAQLQILSSIAAAPFRFTARQSDAALAITNTGGSSMSHYFDGRESRLSGGGIEATHSARWVNDRVLAIEWKPEFGGTIRESYTLVEGGTLLQLDQTVEHRALVRPARQRVAYRKAVDEPPAQPPAAGAQQPAGQVADTTYRPAIDRPAYPAGTGPSVLIDEAHANFHTATGRFLPVAELLRRDGYVVNGSSQRLTPETLRQASLLVIANAREPVGVPEVNAIRDWVAGGGSLLLIVDHPPNVAASIDLAKAFDIRLLDKGIGGRLTFRKSDGTLRDHPITKGIEHVMTFTGSSFTFERGGEPLLVFGPGTCTGGFDPSSVPVQGHLQGAVTLSGAGRVGIFAEAAMFTAQVAGPARSPMGMNDPEAGQNAQFLLNVVHWLSGLK